MVKRWAVIGVVLCLAAGLACAADTEKFKDEALGISMDAPEGFTKPDQNPPFPEDLGKLVGFFADKNIGTTRAMLAIHHMTIPDGATYDQFKSHFEQELAKNFGAGYKLITQADTDIKGFTGFMLDCEVPGDGNLPKEGGSIQHHLRWYFLRDGEDKVTGIIYHSLQSQWDELKSKVETSAKSIKKPG